MRMPLMAALAMLIALPAGAQANSAGWYNGKSHADWWLVDKYADRGEAVFADGERHASADGTSPYIAYLMYAAPKPNGEIGTIVGLIVDCTKHTVQSGSFALIYADGRIEGTMGFYSEPGPLSEGSALSRFACVTDRSSFRHFPDRALSDAVTDVFAH